MWEQSHTLVPDCLHLWDYVHNEAALSQKCCFNSRGWTNCPWHIWIGVGRYQSHFIEMKELAQTAIWDVSHSFFRWQKHARNLRVMCSQWFLPALVPPHHKFLFMLTYPTGRPLFFGLPCQKIHPVLAFWMPSRLPLAVAVLPLHSLGKSTEFE